MKDLFDQTVSTASATAARLYDQAVDLQLHAWPGALDALQGAIARAPDFALPHALHALVLAGRGERAAALQSLGAAQQAVAGATERERSQVALFTAVIEGRTLDALGQVVAHAQAHPADLLAASTALGAYVHQHVPFDERRTSRAEVVLERTHRLRPQQGPPLAVAEQPA